MEKHLGWIEPEEKDLEKKVLGDYSSDEVRRHLEYLTTLTRVAGTEDERRTAQYIKKKLDDYGIDAEIYEFDAYISHPEQAEFEILSPIPKSSPCLPHAFIASTPPGGMEAELISLGKGSESDYHGVDAKGKIVLIDPGGGGDQVQAARIAEEKGAAAQVHITRGEQQAIKLMQLRSTWGAPTPETIDKIPKTPAISISNEDGIYLKELTQKGRVVVRLKADAWRGYRKIQQPVGTLRGTKQPEKYVLFGAHYCSWYVGATDNAAANALMLEMARVLANHRKSLGRSIKFAWWTGHTQGTFAGSTWYLDHFWDDIRDHAIAYLNMDAIGRAGSSEFSIRSTDEIGRFHEAVVKEVLGLELKSNRFSKVGDQSFWGLGLPSFTGNTVFPGEEIAPVGGGPYWYMHTEHDTLDKVDLELIQIPFKVYCTSLLRICNNPVLPLEFVNLSEAIGKGLTDLQKEASSHLNLASLKIQVEELREKSDALNKIIATNLLAFTKGRTAKGLTAKFDQINECLMALSRILMPVICSKVGKYGQDPMGSRFKLLPLLQPLTTLNSLGRETDAYRALRISLLRERNRLADALDLANRIISKILPFKEGRVG